MEHLTFAREIAGYGYQAMARSKTGSFGIESTGGVSG